MECMDDMDDTHLRECTERPSEVLEEAKKAKEEEKKKESVRQGK